MLVIGTLSVAVSYVARAGRAAGAGILSEFATIAVPVCAAAIEHISGIALAVID